MASTDPLQPLGSSNVNAENTHDPFYSPHDDLIYREQQRIMAEAANMDRDPAASPDFQAEKSENDEFNNISGNNPSSPLADGFDAPSIPLQAQPQQYGWRPPPLRVPNNRDDEDEESEYGDLEKGLTSKRDQRRCCCCSMKMCVVVTFSACLVLTLLGFFLWPRVPGIQLSGIFDDPNGSHVFDLSHAGKYDWQMGATANMSISNPNYIPWHVNSMDVVMRDLLTEQQIGTANLVSYTLNPQSYVAISVPIKAQYQTSNLTDPTLRNLVASCTGDRPALPVRWIMNFNIAGLSIFGNPSMELQGTWNCPSSVSVSDPLAAS